MYTTQKVSGKSSWEPVLLTLFILPNMEYKNISLQNQKQTKKHKKQHTIIAINYNKNTTIAHSLHQHPLTLHKEGYPVIEEESFL